ncbi:MAG: gluconeogenesis factor YvcK family protein [Bacillota bacterium]
MNLWKWLCPGIKLKRWVAIYFLGCLIAITGALMAIFHYPIDEKSPVAGGIFLVVLGLTLSGLGLWKSLSSLIRSLAPSTEHHWVDVLYQRRYLKRGPKIVAVGGGTGLSVLLKGLKKYTSNLTAIVSVADDGGSSGRLRGELGILPPGDVRNCLLAMADTEDLMEHLLDYRFSKGEGLEGHNLGNLILAALEDITGNLEQAIREVSRVLAVRGQVLPATLSPITLCALMEDNSEVRGESNITGAGKSIKRLSLEPGDCQPLEAALKAIEEADAIILGPGSLYTSVLATLLVPGMANALKMARGPVFYVCNVMTQPGETDYFTVSEHIQALISHCGVGVVDSVIANISRIPPRLLKKYRDMGAYPVIVDTGAVEKLGIKLIRSKLMDDHDLIRHHPELLAQIILRNTKRRTTHPWGAAARRPLGWAP